MRRFKCWVRRSGLRIRLTDGLLAGYMFERTLNSPVPLIGGHCFLHGVARKPGGFLRKSARRWGLRGTSLWGEGLPRKNVSGPCLPMVLDRHPFPLAVRLMADPIESRDSMPLGHIADHLPEYRVHSLGVIIFSGKRLLRRVPQDPGLAQQTCGSRR